MSQQSSGEKTEKASSKKKQDARKRGEVHLSRDFVSAASLTLVFALLGVGYASFAQNLKTFLQKHLETNYVLAQAENVNVNTIQLFYRNTLMELAPIVLPIMICVRENGIHRFRVKILRTDDLAIAAEDYCQYTGDYVRMQRRDAFRCPITLDVKLRKMEPEDSESSERPWSQTKTVNISETGMCVSLSSNFERGDLIECNLYINTCGIDAVLPGIPATIVWTMDLLRGKNPLLCGVQFEQIDRKSRDVLLRLVTLGQRKILAR